MAEPLKNAVSMIPFGLLAGFVNGKEVRITELAENGFAFRLAKEEAEPFKLQLKIREEAAGGFKDISIQKFQVTKKEYRPFYVMYEVFVQEEGYMQAVKGLLSDYSRYIQLKLAGDDSVLSERMCGYPARLDGVYSEDLKSWQKKQMEFKRSGALRKLWNQVLERFELSVSLANQSAYASYLSQPFETWWNVYCEENQLAGSLIFESDERWNLYCEEKQPDGHPIAEKRPQRLYIGNSFCPSQSPDGKLFYKLFEKAEKESLFVTAVVGCSGAQEEEETKSLLKTLAEWACGKDRKLEIVVNDWGTAAMIGEDAFLSRWLGLSMGLLMNRRPKDPRMKYLPQMVSEVSLSASWYQKFLKDTLQMDSFEWEISSTSFELPKGGNHHLHLPYYQTNTSKYCTLYARCKNGNRGYQEMPENCPGYCDTHCFLYPDHLQLIGYGNSLFGGAFSVFAHPEILQEYLEHGANRLVLNFF